MIKTIINFVLEKKISLALTRKIIKILKNIKRAEISKEIWLSYENKWMRLKRRPSKRYLLAFISINGIPSENYVPEDLYYEKIEPVLNKKAFSLAYADKNFYERYLHEYKNYFPKTFLRGINGKMYDRSYSLIDPLANEGNWVANNKEFILKPASETSGGKKVVLVKMDAGMFIVHEKALTIDRFYNYLRDVYDTNFIFQEKISQHSFFAAFNETSLNTVRIFTYRSTNDDVVHPLQAVLRFGRKGSIVDNQASGGLSIGINSNGTLNRFYITKWGVTGALSEWVHADQIKDVPGFIKMKEIACAIAKKYYFHRILGFDFCFTAGNEVKLLEINCKNIETNFLQMNNGPLFGDFTDEIIAYCLLNRKSVVLDFEI
jgi:hypothetical protein